MPPKRIQRRAPRASEPPQEDMVEPLMPAAGAATAAPPALLATNPSPKLSDKSNSADQMDALPSEEANSAPANTKDPSGTLLQAKQAEEPDAHTPPAIERVHTYEIVNPCAAQINNVYATPPRGGSVSTSTTSASTPSTSGTPSRSRFQRTPKHKTKYGARKATGKPTEGMKAVDSANSIRVTVTATRHGTEMVQQVTSPKGLAPYMQPLRKYINDPANQKIVHQIHIHEVFNLRHPTDPTQHKKDPPRRPGGYSPTYPVVLTMVNHPEKNTPENREKVALALCALNNSPALQVHGYGNSPGTMNANNLMQFAGDITPSQGVTHAPCLSDFLTIGDLMNCIGELYNTPKATLFQTPILWRTKKS